jgi:hypothetical protein
VVDNTMDALVWLRKQLDGDASDLLREIVREFAQRLMAAEVDALRSALIHPQGPGCDARPLTLQAIPPITYAGIVRPARGRTPALGPTGGAHLPGHQFGLVEPAAMPCGAVVAPAGLVAVAGAPVRTPARWFCQGCSRRRSSPGRALNATRGACRPVPVVNVRPGAPRRGGHPHHMPTTRDTRVSSTRRVGALESRSQRAWWQWAAVVVTRVLRRSMASSRGVQTTLRRWRRVRSGFPRCSG